MRRFLGVVAILVLTSPVFAQADAAAILETAIKAHGGEAKLAKIKAATWTVKGTVYGSGDPTDYTEEWAIQFPSQFRVTLETDYNGIPITQVNVLNGEKGWFKRNKDETVEKDKDEIAADRRQMTIQWLATLLPLRDKAYTLTALPDTKVGDRAAVGIQAVTKDMPEVRLYFDKEKGLLLRLEFSVKVPGSSKEVKQEVLYENYSEVGGIQKAMKHTIRRDGKKFREQEISGFKLLDRLSAQSFEKPS